MVLKNLMKNFLMMKISIGTNIKEGPWGGGNLFAINLKNYLIEKGHKVVSDLEDDDIDIILITEPRRTSESSAFTHFDVKDYLQYVKPDTIVVHRLNECDERKNTNYINQYLISANKVADHSVFVSQWLKTLYVQQGLSNQNISVILAGADGEIFNSEGLEIWNKKVPLKIVTHHWGGNWNKGFDIYQKLDLLLDNDDWNQKIQFTYIGNLPNKFKFKNSNHILPISGKKLANEIKKNHVYLTGSLNEPSGNHHIEAAQCGMPILYIDSGGTPEYCEGFGLKFNNDNFENILGEIMSEYSYYSKKMSSYPHNSEIMCKEYESLFIDLYKNKFEIINKRENKLGKNKFGKKIYSLKKAIKLK